MRARRPEDFTKVWEELGRLWRRRLQGFEKEYLVMRGLAREIAGELSGKGWEGEEAIPRAKKELAWLRKNVGGGLSEHESAPARTRAELPPEGELSDLSNVHFLALSLLLGQEADRDDQVIGFRERHLGGSPLDLTAVEPWIRAQAEEDGVPTQYVPVPVPAGVRIQAAASGELLMNGASPLAQGHPATGAASEAKMLRYLNPQREPRGLGTASGGVLEELRSASEHLVDRLRWGEADATTFILTGRPPLFAEIRGEQEWDELRPFASRITLHIYPIAKPREVARVYAALRSQMLKGRHLQVREKHAALVVFAFRRRELDMSWQEILEAWNESEATHYEKGTYSQLSNLRRDYRKACAALRTLGVNLEWITVQRTGTVGSVATEPGRTLVSSRFTRRGAAYQLLGTPLPERGKTG